MGNDSTTLDPELPSDAEKLRELRDHVAMELLWTEQAIQSRKKVSYRYDLRTLCFANLYKHRFKTSLICYSLWILEYLDLPNSQAKGKKNPVNLFLWSCPNCCQRASGIAGKKNCVFGDWTKFSQNQWAYHLTFSFLLITLLSFLLWISEIKHFILSPSDPVLLIT